jgi:hypothetical protein
MNNYFPAWRKYAALLMLLTTAIIYSCRKDNNTSGQRDVVPSDAQLIANAKAYFDSSFVNNNSSSKQTTDYRTPIERLEKTINWDEAYTYAAHTGKMVMLPIKFKTQVYVQSGQEPLQLSSITRLFIYTGKSGKKHIEVVTRIPDEAYLNNPAKDKLFSGIIKVNDWQGNFIRAYRFTGGKIIRLGAPEYIPINKNNKAESTYKKNELFCYTIPYGEYNYSGDYTYLVTSGYETHCYGSGGGSGYSQDQEFDEQDYTGGGGGAGNTEPPPQETRRDSVKKIIKDYCAGLEPTKQAAIVNALINFADYNCINNGMLKAMVQSGAQFTFCIKSTIATSAEYNNSNKAISFKTEDDMTAPIVAEELFHYYQSTKYPDMGQYSVNNGWANIEFEAALWRDIKAGSYNAGALAFGTQEQQAAYQEWIIAITNNNTTYPTSLSNLQGQYNYYLNIFSDLHPSFGTPINMNPQAIFSNFTSFGCK